jgi:hypothetical protein
MPKGKGTYGSKVGRPVKMKKPKKEKIDEYIAFIMVVAQAKLTYRQ